jgi:polysaccharide deacetylase family protein (PEP-CTERM system associated)
LEALGVAARGRRASEKELTPVPRIVTDSVQSTRHHFTVDVEEYFQVSALTPFVARSSWENTPSRIAVGMRALLDVMAEHDARGTFFVLGWVGKHHPDLVREIAAGGHEVASHGWGHERIPTLSQSQFRDSVRDSKAKLEDLTGLPVSGYRAPSFSITRGMEWALEILAEEGYRYDSSLFPVRRAGYGWVGGARDPYVLQTAAGVLDELPPATIRVGRLVLPAGGGAYFRLFPYAVVASAMKAAARRGAPATFYIHPWELDPGQPRLDVPLKTRIRHYGGLRRTLPRIRRLLRDFRFQPIVDTLDLTNPLPHASR